MKCELTLFLALMLAPLTARAAEDRLAKTLLGLTSEAANRLENARKAGPAQERFLNSDAANQLLARPPGRGPWTV